MMDPRSQSSEWSRLAGIASLGTVLLLSGCYSGVEISAESSPADAGSPSGTGGASTGEDSDADDDDGSGGEPSDSDGACASPDVAVTPLRRMTREQYNNTVAHLLGDTTEPASSFAQDERLGAFASNALATVSTLAVEQYMSAAEDLAASAAEDLDALLPCDPGTIGEDACAEAFIADFGRHAYRRPLAADELQRALGLFEAGRDTGTFADGIQLVIQGMLQSPNFLYHIEYGVDEPGSMVELQPYEVASRLSYFIWGSMPDDALLDAADAEQLSTPQQLEDQAYRMLGDARADAAIGSFHRQWLDVHDLETASKNPEMFEQWTSSLAEAMTTESERFGSHVVRDGDGQMATLFTANYTVANAELAAFYGAAPPADPDEDGFGIVELDPSQRSGLMTQAGWLAGHAHSDQTSPVFRGILVREQLLCQPLPSPPDTVDDTPPAIDPDATAKERFDQLLEDEVCAGCHIMINPIGFGFENYDAVGAYRQMDGNVQVDAVGELTLSDVDGEFDGAIELGERLAESEMVASCMAKQWTRFATGRIEQDRDACAMDDISARFDESDHNIQELIVTIAGSDMMRFIRKAEQ